jgi:hypothetical protein
VQGNETNGDQAGAPEPEAPLPLRSRRVAVSACPWRDDFDYIVALHIDPLPYQSSIVFGVFIYRGTTSFGSTMLWRVTLQRLRGKSPIAMESINGRYYRSQRGVMP